MKNSYFKIGALLLFVGIVFSKSTVAQNSELKWAIGLHVSAHEAKTTLADDFFRLHFSQYGRPGLGFSVRKYLNPSFDLGLHIHEGQTSQNVEGTGYFNNKMWLPSLRLRYKLNNGYIIKNEDAFIGPFLSIGAGMNMSKVNAFNET
jgi:hypothetical protein